MESPLVSIIVPIYNAAMDMVPCLESIKRQRYQNLEVLLVNDGSSDASLEICRMYARLDPRVIIIDKENTGVSGTRNAAIERARGKYLQFVDSDDQLDPNATRLLVEAAEETQADLVICNYCSVMPDGKTTVHGFMQPYTRMDKAQFARCLMEEPASFYYGVMWNKLYRREIIAQNQLAFAPDVHWAEDLIFNMGYLEHAEVFVSIPEAGYHYIQNPKSLCHTQIDLRGIVENKTQIFQLFKEVYTRLGLYEELQPQIYKFLFAFSESGVPSDSLQGALLDAMSRLNDASVQPEPSRKKPRRKPQKHARRKKPRHKEE